MPLKIETQNRKNVGYMEGDPFTRENSLAIKGVAIIMMLWHHCFLPGRFEKYKICFWPLAQSQAVNIASFFKICVSLFAFVSGYGLFVSYSSTNTDAAQKTTCWIREKLVRTLSNYWFVLGLSWILCLAIDGSPYRAYGFQKSTYLGVWNMLIEFFGLTNFWGNEPLNSTWWYMSAAVIFVIVLPFICAFLDKFGPLPTVALLFMLPRICGGYPGGVNYLTFFPAFLFGSIFAKYDLFSKWTHICQSKVAVAVPAVRHTVLAVAILFSYKLYYHLDTASWWEVKYAFIPCIVILFIYDVLIQNCVVNRVCIFLGSHSTNIFLTHTFIRYYYCNVFTYSFGHFAVILSVLCLISLGISFAIEALKRAIKYSTLINVILLTSSEHSENS